MVLVEQQCSASFGVGGEVVVESRAVYEGRELGGVLVLIQDEPLTFRVDPFLPALPQETESVGGAGFAIVGEQVGEGFSDDGGLAGAVGFGFGKSVRECCVERCRQAERLLLGDGEAEGGVFQRADGVLVGPARTGEVLAVGVGIGCARLLLHGGDGAHRESDQTLLQRWLTARDDDGRAVLVGLAEDTVHRGRTERQEEDAVEQFGVGQQDTGTV